MIHLADRSLRTTHDSGLRRLGVVLGLSLAVLGCGGGDNNSGTDTAANTTSSSTDATGTASTTSSSTDGTTDSPTTTSASTSSSSATASSSSTDATGASSVGTSDATTGSTTTASTTGEAKLSFFVSSTGSPTGNLGGLEGADQRCQDLADAVGAGDSTWRAYLSIEHGPDDQPVHARDRIGEGPWFNANLVMIAADLAELHTLDGDADLFLDEHGNKINGQWDGSPDPNEHDILTGSNKDGTVVPGMTCEDWTSEAADQFGWVGHSDGLGPMGNDAENYRPWNAVHENGGCNDTAPKGGAGKIYCFAID